MGGWIRNTTSSNFRLFQLGDPISRNPPICFRYFQNPFFSSTPLKKKSKPMYVFDKIDDALALFYQMIHTHPRPSLVEFNQLLGTIVRMKHYQTALSLFKQMESLGIHLHDVYTLSILLNCFCHLGRMGFGFSVLGRMFKLGLQPNIVTFSTLINGLCNGGQAVKLYSCLITWFEKGVSLI
ncbi:hypothetical protein PTKIN_Ptkin16aG0030100 [Pterospermum kingtungense]